MKKLLLVLAVAIASFATTSVYAQSGVYASEYVNGTYTGTLDELVMNGKDGYDPVVGQQFTLNGSTLTATISKIGSMPGTIYLSVDVTVDPTSGQLRNNGTAAGTLQLPIGRPIQLSITSFSGDITKTTNGSYVLDLDCAVTGRFLGIPFPASFHFTGTK